MDIDYEVLLNAALAADIEPENLRTDYSGRAMYGSTCLGIVGSIGDVVRFLFRLAIEDEALAEDIANLRLASDQMGLDDIHYWPSLHVENAPVES